MESTLCYIHNDSDLSTNSSFSPDEERRSKVQVSDSTSLCGECLVHSSSKPISHKSGPPYNEFFYCIFINLLLINKLLMINKLSMIISNTSI